MASIHYGSGYLLSLGASLNGWSVAFCRQWWHIPEVRPYIVVTCNYTTVHPGYCEEQRQGRSIALGGSNHMPMWLYPCLWFLVGTPVLRPLILPGYATQSSWLGAREPSTSTIVHTDIVHICGQVMWRGTLAASGRATKRTAVSPASRGGSPL